jgi:dGTPase
MATEVVSSSLLTTARQESLLLAPYAMHSADSRGRKYPEPEHPYRGAFQRDRDRILHCSAFRRLSGKMQVFTGDMGDYHRTRLTHTHEVASIARTMGRALRLNEDLIEALALFHDIGHPPYGHAGEDALNELLRDFGGFSHNRNALTIAEELEGRYPNFSGLNLTYEVLEGQQTRVLKEPIPDPMPLDYRGPLLEVQVVEAADSMTYDAHDSDDAVKLGLVSLADLQENTLVREAVNRVHRRYANVRGDVLRKAVVHELIDRQVTDVLRYTSERLAASAPPDAEAARRLDWRVGCSEELCELKEELEAFLYDRVYRHPKLIAMRAEAQQRMRQMFYGYLERLDLLPERHRRRAERVGPERAVGDYLAGMTDRFCEQIYELHFAS